VEPVWKSEVDQNGGTGRALSEGLMIQMTDRIRTNGGKTTLILQSLGVRRSYFNLLSQLRQTVNTQDFTGGFKGLAFTTDQGEIPTVADVDAPLGQQLFLNEDALTFYRDEEWHWLDRDGQMWKQVRDATATTTPGTPAWSSTTSWAPTAATPTARSRTSTSPELAREGVVRKGGPLSHRRGRA
jgi:hypothetical protein